MSPHDEISRPVVSRDECLVARKELLAGRRSSPTRLRDELNAKRRALSWVKVETER